MKIETRNPALVDLWLHDGTVSHWDTHEHHPVADWQYEVENNNTRQGYWDWVINELEAADDPEEPEEN